MYRSGRVPAPFFTRSEPGPTRADSMVMFSFTAHNQQSKGGELQTGLLLRSLVCVGTSPGIPGWHGRGVQTVFSWASRQVPDKWCDL